jgi:uncharacterized membrane protein YiaA
MLTLATFVIDNKRVIFAVLVYAVLAICTIFNAVIAVRGRSPVTGKRLDGRLLVWCSACALVGIVLLVMALAN